MPARKKTSTTRLPQTLREEIDKSEENHHTQGRWSSRVKISRKEARKQERIIRKQSRAEFFTSSTPHHKRAAEGDHIESPKRKKPKHVSIGSSSPSRKVPPPMVQAIKDHDPKQSPKAPAPFTQKISTTLEKLVSRPNKSRLMLSRSRQEEEEDSYIAYLESKLGYAKGGKKKSSGEDDGLDDLLDLATSVIDTKQQNHQVSSGVDEMTEDSGLESESESEGLSGDEWKGIDEYEEQDESHESNHSTPQPSVEAPTNATRYIPPHLRCAQIESDKNSEATVKLTRQLKGLLNRMSEQNMASIVDSIENIYRNHRRNDVTSVLTTLVVDGIASHSSLLDSYVVLYAAFVSSLHKVVGIEFAAYFVQNVVLSYERHYVSLQGVSHGLESDGIQEASTEMEGKECSNLIVLLSELYNFQVISSVLVFDVIQGLLKNELTEFGIELLLKIVRNSGQQLRQDDPSALKDIIQIVQKKVSDRDDILSSRTQFMIETLTNLKNNKLKRNMTQNQGGEAVERMKKFLSGLAKKRHILAHEPLRVSLNDLRSAETKGKWWLVGAAWGGDPLVDRRDLSNAKSEAIGTTGEITDSRLLKLARRQGMNTDIRRSIFVVLMSSDDYVDACERLSQLNLTEMQQREIIRVILHCCGNERSYNPYYTLVCQQLCRSSHSYKITLQFCLWDFLRDMGEVSVGGAQVIKSLQDDGGDGFGSNNVSDTRMQNVARAYAWWIAKDCVSLAILKPVDFTSLKVETQGFLREMLVQIFISSQVASPLVGSDLQHLSIVRSRRSIEEIFIKATRIQHLAMGLIYFMSEVFRNISEEGDMAELVKWADAVGKDTLRTGIDTVPGF